MPLERVEWSSDIIKNCIGKKVLKRRIPVTSKTWDGKDKTSSLDESSSPEDSEGDSAFPVFRKSHSVLPGIKLSLTATDSKPTPTSTLQSVPPPGPWFPSLESYVDVFIDGSCSFNGRDEPSAGIGVWFGQDSTVNVC